MSNKNRTSDYVPMRMKLGYSIGDFGANLAFHTTGFYLMFFFTDVFGIVPALAGVIFLYAKMWDAVSDPIMGAIADHTKTRWGKMRPYLLIGAVPLGIAFYLMFFSPNLAPHARFLYGLFTFIFFCTAITVVNVPYLALTPLLTTDSHERSVVTGIRVAFGIIGALAAAGATLPLVGLFGKGDQVLGFRMTGLVYAVIIVVVTVISFITVREKVREIRIEKASVKENIWVVLKNRPFLILTSGTLMHMIAMNIMAIVVNYYFKYYLDAEPLIPIAFLSLFVTAALSLPIFVKLSKRRSKRFAYNVGMGIVAAVMVLIFFFGHEKVALGGVGVPLIFVFLVLAGVGLSTNWLSPWSMIPDTVEYSEWKTGLRREGILYGIFYFVFKAGTALAGFLVGSILAFTGYVANIEQSGRALMGIRSVMTLVPTALLILGIVIISFYPIDAAAHRKMLDDIAGKKA